MQYVCNTKSQTHYSIVTTFKRLNKRILEFNDSQYKKEWTDFSFNFTGSIMNNTAYSGSKDRHKGMVGGVWSSGQNRMENWRIVNRLENKHN